jgi:hypothetical protein
MNNGASPQWKSGSGSASSQEVSNTALKNFTAHELRRDDKIDLLKQAVTELL